MYYIQQDPRYWCFEAFHPVSSDLSWNEKCAAFFCHSSKSPNSCLLIQYWLFKWVMSQHLNLFVWWSFCVFLYFSFSSSWDTVIFPNNTWINHSDKGTCRNTKKRLQHVNIFVCNKYAYTFLECRKHLVHNRGVNTGVNIFSIMSSQSAFHVSWIPTYAIDGNLNANLDIPIDSPQSLACIWTV